MDARVRTGVALAVVAASAVQVCARDGASESDTVPVAAHLLELRAEEGLDETLLLELDELLVDPVDLASDDAVRLRVLPWLNNAQIDALRNGAAPHSVAELATLPGWDVESARRTMAFVRFAPRSAIRSGSRVHIRSAMLRTRRDLLLDTSVRPVRIVGRWTSASLVSAGRAFEVELRNVRVVAGDFRVRHAQGLLWWSGEDRFRAATPALRSASGLFASISLEQQRAVRGVGFETSAVAPLRFIIGESVHGRIAATMLAVPASRLGTLQLGWIGATQRTWMSAAWALRTPRTDFAVEVAGRPGRTAMLAGAAWRRPRVRLRARIERAMPGSLSPWSVASPTRRRNHSRHALLQTHLRFGQLRIDLAAAHAARRDSLGTARQSREHTAQMSWSRSPYTVDLRLRERAIEDRSIGLETFTPPDISRTRSIVLRLHARAAAAATIGLEYRGIESQRLAAGQTHRGSAWVLRLQQHTRVAALDGIVATYGATSGHAAPYVPQPYVAGTFASRRVLGNGILFAAGLSLGPSHFRLRTRGSVDMSADDGAVFEAETSLSIRLH